MIASDVAAISQGVTAGCIDERIGGFLSSEKDDEGRCLPAINRQR